MPRDVWSDGGNDRGRADVTPAAARSLSTRINAWESRWPLNTYRERDAGKLSRTMLDRLAQAEAMSPEDYAAALTERVRIRNLYAELATQCDGCVTLAAPGAAPVLGPYYCPFLKK